LLVILALLGGAVGTLALAQDLTGADLIYWSVQTPIAPATAGPFVHYSHYSQFMNLCIGAALGLLLIRLQNGRGKASRVEATWSDEPRRHRSHRSGRSRRSRSQSADSATQPWLTWWLVATVLLGIGTVFLSFSRGGVISLLAAAAFTTVAVAIGRKIGFRSWLLTVLILAGVLGTFYIGFDTVYQRMATLGRFSVAAGSRWEMLTYLTAVWKQFPTLGTGMGTHEVVYPMFTRWTIAATATHAENEYAQVLEETGFSGLLLMLAFAAIVWGGYVRAVRGVRTAAIGAAAFGLGFGLLAVMVHSLGDFGQHLPANALMTSVSCALLLNLGHLASSSKQGKPNASPVSSGNPTEPTNAATQGASPASSGVAKPRSPRALSFTATIVALAAVTGVCLWALPAANQARLAEDSWRTAELAAAALRQRGWQGSDDEYANLITNAATASDLQPDNVKYQYWLNVYRWQSISRDQDPVTGQAQITLDDLSYVQRIITELHHARVLCPTFGPNLSVAGQLEKFVLDDPAGAAHIRSGYAISPCDPASCFAAGRLDAQDGHWEPATTEFARAIALDGSMFHPAAAVFLQAGRPDEAIALAGADENALRGIADMLEQSGQGPDLAARARQQAFALLQARCQSPDADASSLANLAGICFQKNDYPAAARYYRRAVDLQYDQSDWRYQLALSLEQTGKSVDALHEAQICLRLRPQWTEAQQLVEKLAAAVHSQ
jgi:tetratricopeptide (TPR) repeat protein